MASNDCVDAEIYTALGKEAERLEQDLELVACGNAVSRAVLERCKRCTKTPGRPPLPMTSSRSVASFGSVSRPFRVGSHRFR